MPSSYDIINDSPYFKNWFDGLHELAPDTELEEDQTLIGLRKTSLKLIKNNFIASAAQLAYINTVLGGKITLDVLSTSKSFEKEVKRVFGETMNGLDINRQYSLTQIAEQIVAAAFAHGDILINLPRDKRHLGKIKTYVELVEASRIKTPPKYKNNNLVKEGVHYYESGRIKGYWVIKRQKQQEKINYYTAQDSDFDFFPVYKKDNDITRRVCWLFKAPLNLRPNQSRGIPVLTGIMELLRYIDQYLEAVLVGSRVAACFAAFVKSNNPVQARKSLVESDNDASVYVKGKRIHKLQPGTIASMKNTDDIVFATPNRPSDNFDTFVLRLFKSVAMNLRIPYEQMFLDLSQTNYSSWRGGSLETERNVNRWERDLEDCLRWIVMTFLQEALVTRELKGTLKGMTLQITFPVYKTLDEEKTSRARRLNLDNGSTSQHREQAGLGKNYEQLQEELTKEALDNVEKEAKILIRKKELEEEHDIIFPDQVKEDRDTSGSRREGEEKESDLDDEDAKERRKDDDNW